MADYTYTLLIPLIPLFVFLFLGLLGHKMKPFITGLIGTTGLGISAILSYATAYRYFIGAHVAGTGYTSIKGFEVAWLHLTEKLTIHLGVLIDPISVMMLVVITTVSLMVHIYSIGYMKGDPGFYRFFSFLSFLGFLKCIREGRLCSSAYCFTTFRKFAPYLLIL